VSLIEAHGYPGNFSPSFSELQRNFVKHRPTKLKSLLRLVKHWYLQVRGLPGWGHEGALGLICRPRDLHQGGEMVAGEGAENANHLNCKVR